MGSGSAPAKCYDSYGSGSATLMLKYIMIQKLHGRSGPYLSRSTQTLSSQNIQSLLSGFLLNRQWDQAVQAWIVGARIAVPWWIRIQTGNVIRIRNPKLFGKNDQNKNLAALSFVGWRRTEDLHKDPKNTVPSLQFWYKKEFGSGFTKKTES